MTIKKFQISNLIIEEIMPSIINKLKDIFGVRVDEQRKEDTDSSVTRIVKLLAGISSAFLGISTTPIDFSRSSTKSTKALNTTTEELKILLEKLVEIEVQNQKEREGVRRANYWRFLIIVTIACATLIVGCLSLLL